MRRFFAGCFLFCVLGAPVIAGEEKIVQEVSANGSRNLRPFTVADGWELRWDNKGTGILITVHPVDGKREWIAGSQNAPGKGSSYQPKGGTYYLEVMGFGNWTVTVVQLP